MTQIYPYNKLITLISCLKGLLYALILCAASLQAHASNPPSAYDFMKPSNIASVELSPSGRYIAFVGIKTNKYCIDRYGAMVVQTKARCKEKKKNYRSTHTILVFDLETLKVAKRLSVPENVYVAWLEWASDDRILAAISVPTTIGERGNGYIIGGSRIISIPLAADDYAVLFSDQKRLARQNRYLTKITNMLRSDPDHVIMPANKAGDLDLWKVNVLTGAAERIATGKSGTFYWYTDKTGAPVMRFDCVGRSCRKINVFAFEDEAWKKIKTFRTKPDEDEEEYDFWPIALAPTKGQFYVMSNEDDAERRSIKIYDVKTEEYVKTVFEHPEVDVGGAILDLQTGAYAGAWFYEDRLNYKFENTMLQKHYKGLNTYFNNNANVDLLGFSADGSKAIVYVTGPNNPGAYHIYDLETRNVTHLFGRRTDMDERLSTATDILKIPTRDGKPITAYYSYPASGKTQNTPLIVMPHGGPEARDYYDYDSTAQYFATHGYQVLQVNFRGSSGFGRAFAEAGYGEWGGLMQNDVIDATKYLYAQNLANDGNACMVGYSYGGYVSLYAGANSPELFNCFVSGGGLGDLLADLKHTKKDSGSDSETYEYWLKSMGHPKTDKDKLKAVSPIYMADKFKDPVLLIHGEYDSIVDVSQSRKMHKVLKKAGVDVQFVELEDVGHYDWDLETEILYLETVEAFLEKHLTK